MLSIHQNGAISQGKRPAPQYSTPRRAGVPVGDGPRDLRVLDLVGEEPRCRVLRRLPDVEARDHEEREQQRPDIEQAVAERLRRRSRFDRRHDAVTVLPRLRQERNSLSPARSANRPAARKAMQIAASTRKIFAGNSRSVCVLVTKR